MFQWIYLEQSGWDAGIRLIERMGRRKLLLSSLAGVIAALSALVATFFLSEQATPDVVPAPQPLSEYTCPQSATSCLICLHHGCGFCSLGGSEPGWCLAASGAQQCTIAHHAQPFADGCPSPYSAMLLLLLMAYLLTFAAGLGPVPWAVNAEIYPLRFRGAGSGLAGTANWVTNGVVSQTFLLLVHAVRPSGAFAAYAGIAVLAAAWVGAFLPETKGLSLAEVQAHFARRCKLSQRGAVQDVSFFDDNRHAQAVVLHDSEQHWSESLAEQ